MRPSVSAAYGVLRMVSGGQHNILSHPNEHHIWFSVLVSCKVRPQWRGETEATCRTGSARLPVTDSPPFSLTRMMFVWLTLALVWSRNVIWLSFFLIVELHDLRIIIKPLSYSCNFNFFFLKAFYLADKASWSA